MKLFIASDIHGSAFYCKKMLQAFEKECADRLILLGDILYHGPRNDLPEGYAPKEVIELLSEYKDKLICVRGNCDTEVDQMVLPFPILADYALLCEGDLRIYATHGHKYSQDAPPPLCKGDILLCGHTHIPCHTDCGNFLYINPGSVSIPKESSAHSYISLEERSFLWKDLEGNIYDSFSL